MLKNLSIIIVIIFFGLNPQYLYCQRLWDKTKCYQDEFPDTNKVFQRIEVNPSFKVEHYSFPNYIAKSIRFDKIINNLNQNEQVYADTARIKFIIMKDGKMSNLTVKQTKKPIFQEEITKIIKESSCFWNPGTFSGRYVTAWFQLDIYCTISRNKNEITIKVGYKEYDHPTNSTTLAIATVCVQHGFCNRLA